MDCIPLELMTKEAFTALIVTNDIGLNGLESGASLRIETLQSLIEGLGLQVEKVSLRNFIDSPDKHYKLIVLTPFTAVRVSKKARKNSNILWLDHCDSWIQTRFSRLYNGELKQIVALMRDVYYLISKPKYEVQTFISLRDSRILRRRTALNTYIVPNVIKNYKLDPSYDPRLVFIGDGKYKPNQSAVNYLESILKFLPKGTYIHVFGRGYKKSHPNIVFHGYAPSAELYRQGDVHLAPIFYGAGIKNKVAIPLSLGLPVVTTQQGANGINPCSGLYVENKPEKFVKAIQSATETQTPIFRNQKIYSDDESSELIQFLRSLI